MGRQILIWLAIFISIEGRSADRQDAPSLLWEGREVVSIGIGMSEETADAPVSVFGHLFAYILTVGPDGKRWPLDFETAINVAVVEGGSPLEAGYHLVPLHRMLHEAITKEGRSVVLLDLNLTPEEIAILLAELKQRQGKSVRYDLIRRNCSFYILNWLTKIKPGMAKETRWRVVWTPRQAADLIESNFVITRRERLTANMSWAQDATKAATEPMRITLADAGWCKNGEGALIGAGYLNVGRHGSGGFSAAFGQRSLESDPVPLSGPTALRILEVSHYGALPDGTTSVKLVEFENLREVTGPLGRLSQRLSVDWQHLPEADSLRNWIGRYETGASWQMRQGFWFSALGGMALCEGGSGPIRPSASAGLLWLGKLGSTQARYVTTGGQHQGLEVIATLHLTSRTHLKAQWTDCVGSPSSFGFGLETRF